MEIEHFGNADNLMIDACLAAQGRAIVRNRTSARGRYRDLRGFEVCLGAPARSSSRCGEGFTSRLSPLGMVAVRSCKRDRRISGCSRWNTA
jgi:hypothetical protein